MSVKAARVCARIAVKCGESASEKHLHPRGKLHRPFDTSTIFIMATSKILRRKRKNEL